MSDRLTFRPGNLAGPLAEYCKAHQCTPAEAVRKAVATMLGVEAPAMQRGNPRAAEQSKLAAAARWGRTKKKNGRK